MFFKISQKLRCGDQITTLNSCISVVWRATKLIFQYVEVLIFICIGCEFQFNPSKNQQLFNLAYFPGTDYYSKLHLNKKGDFWAPTTLAQMAVGSSPPAALDGMHCSTFVCIFQYSVPIFAAIVQYIAAKYSAIAHCFLMHDWQLNSAKYVEWSFFARL